VHLDDDVVHPRVGGIGRDRPDLFDGFVLPERADPSIRRVVEARDSLSGPYRIDALVLEAHDLAGPRLGLQRRRSGKRKQRERDDTSNFELNWNFELTLNFPL